MDKNEENIDRQILGVAEFLAMELRFEGYSYKDITARLKLSGHEFSQGSIQNWFAKGGKLYEFYADYVHKETEERKKQTIDMFGAHLDNALRVMVGIMGKSRSDMVRFLAAKEIMNRVLGEPVKLVKDTEEKSVLDEYFARLKEITNAR